MKLAFDTGGTFTDLALLDNAGVVHPHKVLSTPDDPSRAVLCGIDELLAMRGSTGRDVTAIFGATTVVTNALLERKGAVTALITTDGFQDILRIRTEGRYDLYDLKLQFSEPLVPRQNCFGARERVSVDGEILLPLDEVGIIALADELRARGIEAIAVCLMHSYRYGEHEARIRTLLQTHLPGISVSLSSVVCPEIREYDRASTTVVNAYTRPLMAGHVKQLEGELAKREIGQLLWMTFKRRRRAGRGRQHAAGADDRIRPGRRRGRRLANTHAEVATPTCCPSTWAAPRPSCACCWTASRASRRSWRWRTPHASAKAAACR